MTGRRWIQLVAVVWTLLLSACSSFEREWNKTVRAPAARAVARTGDFAGAWDGQWTSEKHRLPSGQPAGGRLRCLFTPVDGTHYRARFHANWLIFATGYEVTFETQRRGRTLHFRGKQDLGTIFGGVYRYEGVVTPQHFNARFASRYDHGRFDLDRPQP